MRSAGTKFVFRCSDAAKDMLLREGLDYRYGARHLKRSVERLLVFPLSNLMATGQVEVGDSVFMDLDEGGEPVFSKRPDDALIGGAQAAAEGAEEFAALYSSPAHHQGLGMTA